MGKEGQRGVVYLVSLFVTEVDQTLSHNWARGM